MDHPDLFLTRKKVAEDIQRLNAIPKLDKTGIAIRVGALQSKVAELPMLLLTQADDSVTAEPEQLPETWYEHLAASFQQLSLQWFDVRHHGSGYSPLISEQDEQQLRFAMMMTLQTIQFAILHNNNDLFQASLLQLKSRLTNYFDAEDSQVLAILLEVDQLLALKVTPQQISPLGSLAALNNYRLEKDKPASPGEEEASEDQGVLDQ
jgi:uroporphyrin-3 C-methyltransferase